MSDTHEVISAFLDDEPFDSAALASALSDRSGRALLIDLVALRHIVQPEEAGSQLPAPARTWRSSVRPLLAAAAVLIALAGGYFVGTSRDPSDDRPASAAASEAPAPTRVVQGPAAWRVADRSTQ